MSAYPDSSVSQPEVRVFFACPRSGSALLMRIFAESPVCAVTSRLTSMGEAQTRRSYGRDCTGLEEVSNQKVFMDAARSGKKFLISKEEPGNDGQKGELLYDITPTLPNLGTARPVFLVRDPVRVYDSWRSVGWTDVSSFHDCYVNMFRMLDRAPPHAISCLVYERLIVDPETEIKRVCARWGILYTESMLRFEKPFGSYFFFNERERSMYCEEKTTGLFSTVENRNTVEKDVPCHELLSNSDKEYVEEHMGRLYLSRWPQEVAKLQAILLSKDWFAFDLDDTLHEFRRASGMATSATLELISSRFGTPKSQLEQTYSKILKEKTQNAFSDGKTSHDYRRERFTALLETIGRTADVDAVDPCLEIYERTLTASLELKCGASSLLSMAKSLGKKIAVITEGPQDAQERTVRALGIDKHVDFLATTNHFGLTKTTGLFKKVLEHLNVTPGNMVYFGDNEARDVIPATAEGIFSIHLDEKRHIDLEHFPVRINTLRKAEFILSSATAAAAE